MSDISISDVYDEVCLIKDAMQDGFASVDCRLAVVEKQQTVIVRNGGLKSIKIADLAVQQHNKINEVYNAVEIFIDLAKIYKILKKHKSLLKFIAIFLPVGGLLGTIISFLF